jgi:predicted RND superfamily exporter protein
VAWERRILSTSGRSGFAAVSSADSVDDLRRRQEAFRRLPTVSSVDSALLLVPDDQEEKRKIIGDFAPLVAPITIGRPTSVALDRLMAALETLKRRFDLAAAEAPPGDLQRQLREVGDDVGRLLGRVRARPRDVSEPALTLLQQQLYRDFVRSFQRLQANLTPGPVGLADVPDEVRRRFVSDEGQFLLQVYPAVNIWDREGARRFVTDLRSVDPAVTGHAVITYEAIRIMERSYKQGTLLALLLVSVLTWLMLRRVLDTALALLPLGLGLVWTVGLMYAFGLPFNLSNIFGLPLIIGSAAEYGLNLVVRYSEGRAHGGPLIARSTMMAVLVNGLTTVVGFGSLMMADHRGIFGLGLLLTLGTGAAMLAALVVLPVLLQQIGPRFAPVRTRGPGGDPLQLSR